MYSPFSWSSFLHADVCIYKSRRKSKQTRDTFHLIRRGDHNHLKSRGVPRQKQQTGLATERKGVQRKAPLLLLPKDPLGHFDGVIFLPQKIHPSGSCQPSYNPCNYPLFKLNFPLPFPSLFPSSLFLGISCPNLMIDCLPVMVFFSLPCTQRQWLHNIFHHVLAVTVSCLVGLVLKAFGYEFMRRKRCFTK